MYKCVIVTISLGLRTHSAVGDHSVETAAEQAEKGSCSADCETFTTVAPGVA